MKRALLLLVAGTIVSGVAAWSVSAKTRKAPEKSETQQRTAPAEID